MPNYKHIPVFICGLAIVTVALACGPDFKILLPDRASILKSAPVTVFAHDVAHLLDDESPNPSIKPKIPVQNYLPEVRRHDLDTKELTTDQLVVLNVMEDASDGDDAYGEGAGLPSAVRLYVAAAIDFKQQDMEKAGTRFKAILDLPGEDSKPRAVLAAFMLGRIALKQVESGNTIDTDTSHADKYFELTRSLVAQGLDDPLGLALASYGEQAKAHLVKAGFTRDAETIDKGRASNVVLASQLYAKQAALGSISGLWSLQEVSQWLFDDKARLVAVIDDPFMQNLLVAYASSKESPSYDMSTKATEELTDSDGKLTLLLEASRAKGLKLLARSEGLALLAYRAGRYDEAAAFSNRSAKPLAHWIKAKLAMQKGDLAQASDYYHQALTGFSDIQGYSEDGVTGAVRTSDESGLLNVARGDFMSALKLLYRTSWIDAAYIAERILTTEELVSFVDKYAPEPPSSAKANEGVDRALNIRWLLARRLMREGEFSRALAYFPNRPIPDQAAGSTTVQEDAKNYISALALAEDPKTTRREKAKAWFSAAKLERAHGMEIMGYEMFPDFNFAGGNFSLGNDLSPEKVKDKQFVADEEPHRFDATRPIISERFHYRYIAVQEAEKAAELLPGRSQAYAAILCAATGWMLSTGATKPAADLYRRYVKNGRAFDWASHFGHDCPEPDFSALGNMDGAS